MWHLRPVRASWNGDFEAQGEKEAVIEAFADADGSPMGRRSKLVRRPTSQVKVVQGV